MADTVDSLTSDTTPDLDAPAPDLTTVARPAALDPAEPAAPELIAAPSGPDQVTPLTIGLVAWRCLHLVTTVVALILLSLVMIVVAILVKRFSPGPIIFRQTRVGRCGIEFELWKFRTTHDGTHQLVLQTPRGVLFGHGGH